MRTFPEPFLVMTLKPVTTMSLFAWMENMMPLVLPLLLISEDNCMMGSELVVAAVVVTVVVVVAVAAVVVGPRSPWGAVGDEVGCFVGAFVAVGGGVGTFIG